MKQGDTMGLNKLDLAHYLETVILKTEGTRDEIVRLCEDAIKYRFVTAVVHSVYVPLVHSIVRGTSVGVCTAIGFPFGANTTATKVFESREAIRNGATELDMMMFMGAFKGKDYAAVRQDIDAVIEAADGRIVKVIIETALLSREEKIQACQIAAEAGASYVKTSTGNALPGATVEDIRLMRQTVGDRCGVKASGGITTLEQTLAFIEAGATRVASRAAVDIVEALK
jgi:deoxyribose-phosphate aldolase